MAGAINVNPNNIVFEHAKQITLPLVFLVTNYDLLDNESKIRIDVQRLCGTDKSAENKVNALTHKLCAEYAGEDLHSKDADISMKRISLNTLCMHIVPNFCDFIILPADEQECIIRQAISIAAHYTSFDIPIMGDTVLVKLDRFYDKWVTNTLVEEDVDFITMPFYDLSQRAITHWINHICPLLQRMEPIRGTYVTDSLTYSEVTFSLDYNSVRVGPMHVNEAINNEDVRCYFYSTSMGCDLLNVDRLYEKYKNDFSSLLIISHELEVHHKLVGKYKDVITIPGKFHGTIAYFSYLIYNEQRLKIPFNVNVDIPNNVYDILVNQYPLTSHKTREMLQVFRVMMLNSWLWKDNDMSSVYAQLRFLIASSLNQVGTLGGIKCIIHAVKLIAWTESRIRSGFDLLVANPMVGHCGGNGVDLYCNDLVHSTSTVMLMVEVTDAEIVMAPILEVNMLNRKVATIGHQTHHNVVARVDGIESKLTRFQWVYKKTEFYSIYKSENGKKVEAVYFYQRYQPALMKFVCIQALRVRQGEANFIEYAHPHSPATLSVFPLGSSTVQEEMSQLQGFFDSCNFDRWREQYFPNLHTDRIIDESKFGFCVDAVISSLEYRDELTKFLNIVNSEEQEDDPSNARTDGMYILPNEKGGVTSALNNQLKFTSLLGWVPKVINQVPRYYFDVYRDLSADLYTLLGEKVHFHQARLRVGDQIMFPCPGSDVVWNCRIGQLLSSGCIRASRTKRLPLVAPRSNRRRGGAYRRND